jgi:hypothetical protein
VNTLYNRESIENLCNLVKGDVHALDYTDNLIFTLETGSEIKFWASVIEAPDSVASVANLVVCPDYME